MWHRKAKTKEWAASSIEATAARIRAEQDLERRLDDTTRVKALLDGWRRTRERNGIRDALEITMRGRHP